MSKYCQYRVSRNDEENVFRYHLIDNPIYSTAGHLNCYKYREHCLRNQELMSGCFPAKMQDQNHTPLGHSKVPVHKFIHSVGAQYMRLQRVKSTKSIYVTTLSSYMYVYVTTFSSCIRHHFQFVCIRHHL